VLYHAGIYSQYTNGNLEALAFAALLLGLIAVYSGVENSATFRRVRRIAKSSYYIRHVCLSVRLSVRKIQLGSRWTDFREIYLCIFRRYVWK
jgi:hypothetical protein